jgi:hypothetical protein
MQDPQGARTSRPILAAAAAALVTRAGRDRDSAIRRAAVALRRRRAGVRPLEESRLYVRGRRRIEAHLGRRRDGHRVALAVGVDGSGRSAVYTVEEVRPWRDFERQARLRHAAWGPCRDGSAGL